MSILGQARKRLEDSGVLSSSQRTLPELYGVDNYASLPGVQAHAQFATQAGHALPTDYEGKPVELAEATIMSLCTVRGGTWDPSTNSCILPGAGPVNANDLIRSSDDGTIQQAIDHVGLYPGVTPGQSSVTVADIKQIPTLGAGDVWGAEIFKPGSSQMGTDYTAWDPAIAQYNQDQGGYIFNKILGSGLIPGGNILSNVLGLPSEAPTRPSSTIGTNQYGSKVSIGGGIGQVDAGLAQAAGYDNTGRPTPTVTPSRDRDRDRPSAAERAASAARNAAANRAASKAVKEQQDAGRTESISQKISRGGGFATGGKVGYYEYGGANKATHPGEPRGSDTVPAWLTEGEYVADKDSTDVFEPVLKAINDWEPGMPYDEVLRAMDEFIKMTNNREMDDAVYKQFGGFINNLLGQAGQTPSLERDLRNRAMQARNARVRGELLRGGLGTQGRAQANQAGLITQAGGGLGRSFTPGGDTLDPLGEGLAGRGEAEAQYQQRLGDISQSEFDRAEAERKYQRDITREDKIRAEDQAIEQQRLDAKAAKSATEEVDKQDATKKKAIELANQAKFITAAAATAGDIINGYTQVDQEKIEETGKGFLGNLWEQAKESGGSILTTVAGGHQITRNLRQEALERYVQASNPQSYSAYIRLKRLANQMVFPILESGALGVNPTDADVDLARKATFDVTAPSNTWNSQLNDVIAQARGEQLAAAQFKAVEKEAPKEPSYPDQGPAGGTSTPAADKPSAAQGVINKGWSLVTGG